MCTMFFKAIAVKETEKIKAEIPNETKKMAELFLPFLCGIINRISLLFFTTCLDGISTKYSWDYYRPSPVEIAQRVQKLLRKNRHTGRPSDHVRLVSFSAQANSKPVTFTWIDGPCWAFFPWTMPCLVDAKKSNQVTVSWGDSLKVFFTKGVERQRKVMHCSGADWGN